MKMMILVTAFFFSLMAAGLAQAAQSSNRGTRISADLVGVEETPAVITPATGTFTGTISSDETSITYTLTYSGLQGTVTQAHIHVGQPGVAGGIVIWLCQAATQAPDTVPDPPDCPAQSGTVGPRTVTSADVAPPAAGSQQQVNAGEFADVITAIKNGVAYANVHSSLSGSGEIRGQIKTRR